MAISYVITDDKKILFNDLPEQEMFLAWGMLTNPEMIEQQFPDKYPGLSKKYVLPEDVVGNLHLMKGLMIAEPAKKENGVSS